MNPINHVSTKQIADQFADAEVAAGRPAGQHDARSSLIRTRLREIVKTVNIQGDPEGIAWDVDGLTMAQGRRLEELYARFVRSGEYDADDQVFDSKHLLGV